MRNWSFAKKPFWVFSHCFAGFVVCLFVVLGVWQLSRHSEAKEDNDIVSTRTTAKPLELSEIAWLESSEVGLKPQDLDYSKAEVSGKFVEADFVRIANRSQGGVAGEYVVAIFEFGEDKYLAVNRGFVPNNLSSPTLAELPQNEVRLSGWLRSTVTKEGYFGATDTGEGNLLPRLETDKVASRFGKPLGQLWLHLDSVSEIESGTEITSSAKFPDKALLPPLNNGPHLSYAVQWFIFALLGATFYCALIWRHASSRSQPAPDQTGEIQTI